MAVGIAEKEKETMLNRLSFTLLMTACICSFACEQAPDDEDLIDNSNDQVITQPMDAGTQQDAGTAQVSAPTDAGTSQVTVPIDAGTPPSVMVDAGDGEKDICALPIEPGHCLAYMPRYGFNSDTGECESFIYGGCQGNANRFDTLSECEAACASSETTTSTDAGAIDEHSETSSDAGAHSMADAGNNLAPTVGPDGGIPDVCFLPAQPGNCFGSFPRYYYNPESGTCEVFTFGGCEDGNDNNFLTFGACAVACMGL
jgi:hypothetical protein